ncbi:type VII secretion protein EssB/YukC [Hazenella coriacea]|uniref:Type VII secretion system (Wss) protein YukC n=1 Tax=Hazenella coriacea TaxID=1179467 RepID=A0A4R3L6Z8_9BACL|nr:type VII secretion protein EssB/YukC [Hazenella coriacea]TCS94868.1 type VII secretion system (Wss) protein YukC [Hazenella coriacea]
MKKIPMGDGTLIFNHNDVSYELPIHSCSATLSELDQLRSLLGIGFQCDFYKTKDQTKLVTQFHIEDGFIIYDRVRVELNPPPKLRLSIAQKLLIIAEYFIENEDLVTLFHPLNLFVHKEDGTILILYRGLKGQMPAKGYEEEPIVEQIKRLLLLLFSSARYEELLLNGNTFANRRSLEEYRRVTKRLLQAKSIGEIQTILAKEQEELQFKETQQKSDQADHRKPIPDRKLIEQKAIWIGGWAISLLVASGITFAIADDSEPNSSSIHFIQGLQAAAIHNYPEAVKAFDQLDFNSLTPEERKTILEFYVISGEIDKVNRLDSTFIPKLSKSIPTLPGLRFEKAVFLKDYRTMTELENKVYLDQRRYQLIVDAYLEQNELDNAERVAEESKNKELIERIRKLIYK